MLRASTYTVWTSKNAESDRHITVHLTPISREKILVCPSDGGKISVIGFPDSVDPNIDVTIENLDLGASYSFNANSGGGFSEEIDGTDGIMNNIRITVSILDGSETDVEDFQNLPDKGAPIAEWTGDAVGSWNFELAMGVLRVIIPIGCHDPDISASFTDMFSYEFTEYDTGLIEGWGRIDNSIVNSLDAAFNPNNAVVIVARQRKRLRNVKLEGFYEAGVFTKYVDE